jgi:hypothetical protein
MNDLHLRTLYRLLVVWGLAAAVVVTLSLFQCRMAIVQIVSRLRLGG